MVPPPWDEPACRRVSGKMYVDLYRRLCDESQFGTQIAPTGVDRCLDGRVRSDRSVRTIPPCPHIDSDQPPGIAMTDAQPSARSRTGTPELPQHSLPRSVLLHLLPGIALTVFIVLAAPVVTALGFPVVFALFAGIALVILPLELGILLVHAKRTTGTFQLDSTIRYGESVPRRTLAVWAAGLALWFLGCLVASTIFLDAWLAETFFAWLPHEILQFSATQSAGEPLPPAILAVFVGTALLFNGFVGPIVEEHYFRGYLLPRIDRYGRWAPLINTTLFSLYHLWTPWQNLARIVGFLPITWSARRFRSIQISMVAHITINVVFLLGLIALFLQAST